LEPKERCRVNSFKEGLSGIIKPKKKKARPRLRAQTGCIHVEPEQNQDLSYYQDGKGTTRLTKHTGRPKTIGHNVYGEFPEKGGGSRREPDPI